MSIQIYTSLVVWLGIVNNTGLYGERLLMYISLFCERFSVILRMVYCRNLIVIHIAFLAPIQGNCAVGLICKWLHSQTLSLYLSILLIVFCHDWTPMHTARSWYIWTDIRLSALITHARKWINIHYLKSSTHMVIYLDQTFQIYYVSYNNQS